MTATPRALIKGGSFLIENRSPEEIFTPEDITDQHRLIAQTAREFVEQEVIPRLDAIEAKKPGLLRELLQKAAEAGPLRYRRAAEVRRAGTRQDFFHYRLGGNGARRRLGGHGGCQAGIGILPIAFFGTEDQKEKYVPRLASAEWVGAYCLSEATSASDALNCQDPGRAEPGRKALHPERHQDVGHQRRHRRRLRGVCQSGRREVHGLHRGARLSGGLARRGRAQDGDSRLLHHAAESGEACLCPWRTCSAKSAKGT